MPVNFEHGDRDDTSENGAASRKGAPPQRLDVAIIGAGVSGLATALALCRHPQLSQRIGAITLYDQQVRVGGVLCHKRSKGYLLEGAAQGVLASRQPFADLLDHAGLNERVRSTRPGLRRFLILPQTLRLATASPNPLALVRQGILSFRALLRALCEPLVRRHAAAVNETLFDFVARRFGHDVAQRMIIPLATGIWAGGARRLVARHVMPNLTAWESQWGSVLRGAVASAWNRFRTKERTSEQDGRRRKGLLTLEGGMQNFAEGLHVLVLKTAAEQGIHVTTRLGVTVDSWQVQVSHPRYLLHLRRSTTHPSKESSPRGEVPDGAHAHALFTSVPLWRQTVTYLTPQEGDVDRARDDFARERLEQLASTPSHSVVVVGIGGRDNRPPPQGFGALAPESSPDLLGVLFVHSIAPEHAPAGHFLFRVLLGGDRDPSFTERSDESCLARAREWLVDLGLMTTHASTEFTAVFKWPKVIPLQDEGQDERLRAMAELERVFPGLIFVGNYRTGVGVNDCLLSAQDGVRRWAEQLDEQ